MKNGTKVLIIVGVIVLVLAFVFGGTYNSLVNKKEEVDSALANIDVQLERRADLIPNLVNSVKGYMGHEQNIIDSVTKARENLVNATGVDEKAEANQELTNALNNLFVIVENYPELKSNTNFINLQDELAGTENRIGTARKDYNDVVKDYNKAIKTFPKNLIAGILGFDKADYFEASEGSSKVPNVSFE